MWNLPLQCGKFKCLKYFKLLANFIQCDSKLNGFCWVVVFWFWILKFSPKSTHPLQNRSPVNTWPNYAFGFLPVDPPVDKQKPSRCSSWLLASLTIGGQDTIQAAIATCVLSCLHTMQKSTYQTLWSWSTMCKLNMADQSEKYLATFDLLKISLRKTDPTLDKSNALKGLVVAAVERAEAAGELKGGNPNQIATYVCTTLRYMTGGLLTSGEQRSNTGLTVRPYVSVTKKYGRDAVSGDTLSDVTSNQFSIDSAQSDPAQSRSHVSSAGAVKYYCPVEAPLLFGQIGLNLSGNIVVVLWFQFLHINLQEDYYVRFLQKCFLVF